MTGFEPDPQLGWTVPVRGTWPRGTPGTCLPDSCITCSTGTAPVTEHPVPARAAAGWPPYRHRVVLAQGGTSPGERRDTEFVNHRWMHVGRLWTNGEPFLAVDAT